MYQKIIRNDLKKSAFTSITIVFFVLFASFLLATVALVSSTLWTSINDFVERSQSPHHLQMHVGSFNEDRMASFASQHDNVASYQTQAFLNVDNDDILINGQASFDNFQDNGFASQNPHFDFLLGENNEPLFPEPGQVYVPMTYYLDGTFKQGDTLTLFDLDLEVMGPLRDSQMNSTLSSSKRFLIHPDDYDQVRQLGREEYLIEFRLKDLDLMTDFQHDYQAASLESNGPTISAPLFKIINGLTEGIMIAILLLVGILTLLVSFLCIHFVLTGQTENDYQEIGVLKGLGIRQQKIKKIYRVKYLFLSLLGVFLGYVLALLASPIFMKNIQSYMGLADQTWQAYLFAGLGAILAFLLIYLYINHLLKRVEDISPVEAINLGKVTASSRLSGCWKLRKQKLLSRDSFLSLSYILSQPKLYISLAAIILLSCLILLLPYRIQSSLASDDFISYMGFGEADVLMSQQTSQGREEIIQSLDTDTAIADYVVHEVRKHEVIMPDEREASVWTNLGDHQSFPVHYAEGQAPQAEDELAVSYLLADDFDLEVGQPIHVVDGPGSRQVHIVGIYSDITNGGRTAKACFQDSDKDLARLDYAVRLNEGTRQEDWVADYQKSFSMLDVASVQDYREDYFGQTIQNLRQASLLSGLIALALVGLIAFLFTNLIQIRHRQSISILKSLGFTSQTIKGHFQGANLVTGLVALAIAVGLVNSLGEDLVAAAMTNLGIADFHFLFQPLTTFILLPAMVVLVLYLTGRLSLRTIDSIKISDNIKE